jgi:hypothetical protein
VGIPQKSLSAASAEMLPLPNMFTASAGHGIGGSLLGQLLFADWTRFGDYIHHNSRFSGQARSLTLYSQACCARCVGRLGR